MLLYRMLSAMPLLHKRLEKLQYCDNIAIVFPDDGAFKRFHSLFSFSWSTVVCNKVRNGDKRTVTIKDGNLFIHLHTPMHRQTGIHTHTHTHTQTHIHAHAHTHANTHKHTHTQTHTHTE